MKLVYGFEGKKKNAVYLSKQHVLNRESVYLEYKALSRDSNDTFFIDRLCFSEMKLETLQLVRNILDDKTRR